MEGCYKCMQFLLIGFNFLVLIVGGLAIGLGIWSVTSDYGADEMKEITGSDLYMAACVVVIVGGAVIVIISFLGCCGAWTENRVLLGIYFFIMLLFLILFVVGAVLGFFFRDDLEDELEDKMEETLKEKYGMDDDVTDVWDKIQKDLECCGVDGGISSEKSWFLWQSSAWFRAENSMDKPVPRLSSERVYVPGSCCNSAGGTAAECQKISASTNMPPKTNYTEATSNNPALYETGCLTKVKDEIEDHLAALAGMAVVAFIIMFCCVLFSVCVCMGISRKDVVV